VPNLAMFPFAITPQPIEDHQANEKKSIDNNVVLQVDFTFFF
jgi:hypothetical protein